MAAIKGCGGVHAFSVLWAGEVNLLVLPFYLILWVLQHLVESQAIRLIMVLHWEAQPWWLVLLQLSWCMLLLGRGSEVAVQGPSGWCKLVQGYWTMEAHVLDSSWFVEWRA